MSHQETGIIGKKCREFGIVYTLLITDVTLEPKFTVLHNNLILNTFIQRMCYKSSFQGSSVCMLLNNGLPSCVDEQQSMCDHPEVCHCPQLHKAPNGLLSPYVLLLYTPSMLSARIISTFTSIITAVTFRQCRRRDTIALIYKSHIQSGVCVISHMRFSCMYRMATWESIAFVTYCICKYCIATLSLLGWKFSKTVFTWFERL
jgi:hypothetical protein